MRVITEQHHASNIWLLYCQYGLGVFNNWLTMKKDSIHREEIIAALKFPAVRESAENAIEAYRQKISQIEKMIIDADSQP